MDKNMVIILVGIVFLLVITLLIWISTHKNKWVLYGIIINSRLKKGNIMDTIMKIDQSLLAVWNKPQDKAGNTAEVENIQFVSDDENVATIVPATQEDLDAYNSQWPDTGDGSENRIPNDLLPYAGKVTSKGVLSATQVGITADGEVGEGEKIISSKLTVTVTHGDATTFGDAKITKAVDVAS